MPKRGYKHSEETKRKISIANSNPSEETRRKRSLANLGEKNPFYGKHHTEETKKKISENKERAKKISLSKIGEKNPMKRIEVVKKSMLNRDYKKIGEKISKSKKGKPSNSPTKFKKGHKPKSGFKKGDPRLVGKNNPNWNNGSSFEPYGIGFNDCVRGKIRIRDNHTCQECWKKQEELKKKLCVHHIDYCKTNNSTLNLISLCNKCHTKTNSDRKHWERYFQMKIFIKEFFNPENFLVFKDKKLIGMSKIS